MALNALEYTGLSAHPIADDIGIEQVLVQSRSMGAVASGAGSSKSESGEKVFQNPSGHSLLARGSRMTLSPSLRILTSWRGRFYRNTGDFDGRPVSDRFQIVLPCFP